MRRLMPLLTAVMMTLVLAGCDSPLSKFCPKGFSADRRASSPPNSVWCRGRGAVTYYVELQSQGKEARQTCAYQNGQPEGAFTAWHPGGKVWITGRYQGGVKVGRWSQFDQAGTMVAEGEYRDGRFVAGAPVAAPAVCEKVRLGR